MHRLHQYLGGLVRPQCILRLPPPGEDRQALRTTNYVFLTSSTSDFTRMETRTGHCLFLIFSEWICLFTLTSFQCGTQAEVRCVPSCHAPLATASIRELSALDETDPADAPAGQFVGYNEGSPDVEELTETSSEAEQPSVGNHATCIPEEGETKLSCLSRSASHTDSRTLSVTENSSNDAENRASDAVDGGEDASGWKPVRSARSAETVSAVRPEGGDEASFPDQVEFQLTSSTFALAGDTAHNQAMVHWSGENSSVSRNVLQTHFTHGPPLTQCGQCAITPSCTVS